MRSWRENHRCRRANIIGVTPVAQSPSNPMTWCTKVHEAELLMARKEPTCPTLLKELTQSTLSMVWLKAKRKSIRFPDAPALRSKFPIQQSVLVPNHFQGLKGRTVCPKIERSRTIDSNYKPDWVSMTQVGAELVQALGVRGRWYFRSRTFLEGLDPLGKCRGRCCTRITWLNRTSQEHEVLSSSTSSSYLIQDCRSIMFHLWGSEAFIRCGKPWKTGLGSTHILYLHWTPGLDGTLLGTMSSACLGCKNHSRAVSCLEPIAFGSTFEASRVRTCPGPGVWVEKLG